MKNNRAYSILQVKSYEEKEDGERIISGIATTPSADRAGDTVEPLGAKFKLPMPLLWQHDHDKPVGKVEFAKPTKNGIPFVAKIAKILEPGTLKDRTDEAWQSVKSGLVSAVSIGFNPVKYKKTATGFNFSEWEWIELSLVTIPANSEATINAVKKLDNEILKNKNDNSCNDIENSLQLSEDTKKAGVSAQKPETKKQTKENKKMNIAEQLAALQARKEAHTKRMQEIMEKSVESGETLDEASQEEFDTLEVEIEAANEQIKRFTKLQDLNAQTKTTVKADNEKSASESRATSSFATVKMDKPENKGLALVEYTRRLVLNRGNVQSTLSQIEATCEDNRIVNLAKAAVAVGTTSDPAWVGSLVGEEKAEVQAFLEYLRPRTIIGQLNPTTVKFRTPWVEQTGKGAGYWVGEAKPKPVTSFAFSRRTMEPTKVANIAVLSKESIRDSDLNTQLLVRDSLVAALAERLDTDFINPAKTAVAGVSPASITNGIAPVASAGNTADDVRNDIKLAIQSIVSKQKSTANLVVMLNSTTATALQFMFNPLGQREFAGVENGNILGLRLVVSDYVPAGYVVFANEKEIYVADEGGFSVDYSDQASVQLDDAPADGAQPLVSLWQNNLVGLLAERTISWTLARNNPAVYIINDVNWGAPTP